MAAHMPWEKVPISSPMHHTAPNSPRCFLSPRVCQHPHNCIVTVCIGPQNSLPRGSDAPAAFAENGMSPCPRRMVMHSCNGEGASRLGSTVAVCCLIDCSVMGIPNFWATDHAYCNLLELHQPGIELGSHRWQRCILPLDH